jgi:hypothetical protein
MKNLTNSPRIIFENNTHRLTANEQLAQLEQFGLVHLTWHPGKPTTC